MNLKEVFNGQIYKAIIDEIRHAHHQNFNQYPTPETLHAVANTFFQIIKTHKTEPFEVVKDNEHNILFDIGYLKKFTHKERDLVKGGIKAYRAYQLTNEALEAIVHMFRPIIYTILEKFGKDSFSPGKLSRKLDSNLILLDNLQHVLDILKDVGLLVKSGDRYKAIDLLWDLAKYQKKEDKKDEKKGVEVPKFKKKEKKKSRNNKRTTTPKPRTTTVPDFLLALTTQPGKEPGQKEKIALIVELFKAEAKEQGRAKRADILILAKSLYKWKVSKQNWQTLVSKAVAKTCEDPHYQRLSKKGDRVWIEYVD